MSFLQYPFFIVKKVAGWAKGLSNLVLSSRFIVTMEVWYSYLHESKRVDYEPR